MRRSLVPFWVTLFVAVACAAPPAPTTPPGSDSEGTSGGGGVGGTKPKSSATARPAGTTATATPRPSQTPSSISVPFVPVKPSTGVASTGPTVSPSPTPTPWYEVTTFSGSLTAAKSDVNLDNTVNEFDSSGFEDRPGDAARYSLPHGIAMDAEDNLYVADILNARIRKITPAGVVSTLAGSEPGYLDGPVATAKLELPTGVAVDKKGVVYVAEQSHRIRKIANGQVSTLAGTGSSGFKDGPGAEAQFDMPVALVTDANDHVFVADMNNHRIRKITPDGTVSTLAGSGTQGTDDGKGTAATFRSPNGLVFDTSGNLYVADRSNNMIRQIKPDGTVVRYAGATAAGDQDGPLDKAYFKEPHGISIDDGGRLYVADTGNRLIRQIGTDGTVVTIAGETIPGFRDGKAREARFNEPVSIVSSKNGELLYLVDKKNHRIRKIVYTRYTPPTPTPEPSPSTSPGT